MKIRVRNSPKQYYFADAPSDARQNKEDKNQEAIEDQSNAIILCEVQIDDTSAR